MPPKRATVQTARKVAGKPPYVPPKASENAKRKRQSDVHELEAIEEDDGSTSDSEGGSEGEEREARPSPKKKLRRGSTVPKDLYKAQKDQRKLEEQYEKKRLTVAIKSAGGRTKLKPAAPKGTTKKTTRRVSGGSEEPAITAATTAPAADVAPVASAVAAVVATTSKRKLRMSTSSGGSFEKHSEWSPQQDTGVELGDSIEAASPATPRTKRTSTGKTGATPKKTLYGTEKQITKGPEEGVRYNNFRPDLERARTRGSGGAAAVEQAPKTPAPPPSSTIHPPTALLPTPATRSRELQDSPLAQPFHPSPVIPTPLKETLRPPREEESESASEDAEKPMNLKDSRKAIKKHLPKLLSNKIFDEIPEQVSENIPVVQKHAGHLLRAVEHLATAVKEEDDEIADGDENGQDKFAEELVELQIRLKDNLKEAKKMVEALKLASGQVARICGGLEHGLESIDKILSGQRERERLEEERRQRQRELEILFETQGDDTIVETDMEEETTMVDPEAQKSIDGFQDIVVIDEPPRGHGSTLRTPEKKTPPPPPAPLPRRSPRRLTQKQQPPLPQSQPKLDLTRINRLNADGYGVQRKRASLRSPPRKRITRAASHQPEALPPTQDSDYESGPEAIVAPRSPSPPTPAPPSPLFAPSPSPSHHSNGDEDEDDDDDDDDDWSQSDLQILFAIVNNFHGKNRVARMIRMHGELGKYGVEGVRRKVLEIRDGFAEAGVGPEQVGAGWWEAV